MNLLASHATPLSPSELYKKPMMQTLFYGKTERTYFRDIEKIVKMGFLKENKGKLYF